MVSSAKKTAPKKIQAPLDVLVIGAGPAGIGVAVALRGMGLQRLGVIDAGDIGQSFQSWPEGMRLITPSFPGNQFGTIDLNSIHPSTSPAFSLGTEHPTGPEYASYLKAVANWAHVPCMTHMPLLSLHKENGLFCVRTPTKEFFAKNIVWAAGEFHWPKKISFPGSELALHNSKITFEGIDHMQAFSKVAYNGNTYMIIPQNTGWFSIDGIDLSGISRAAITMGWQKPPVPGYTFEVHLDAPDGNKIGEFTFAGAAETAGAKPGKAAPQFATLSSGLMPVNDGKLHNIYIVSKVKDPKITGTAALSSIQFFIK